MFLGPKIDCTNSSSLPNFQDQFFRKSEQDTPLSSSFSNGQTCENRVTFNIPPKVDLNPTSTLKTKIMSQLVSSPSIFSQMQKVKLIKRAILRLRKSSVFHSKLKKTHYQILDDPVHERNPKSHSHVSFFYILQLFLINSFSEVENKNTLSELSFLVYLNASKPQIHAYLEFHDANIHFCADVPFFHSANI